MHAPPYILIADDEANIAAVLAEVLTDEGYNVRVVYDGASALAAIREHPPALILLDNMMPGITGLDVLRAVRAQGFDDLPTIMMNAASSAAAFLRAGATDFLSKPFFLDDLLDCIEHYMGATRLSPARSTHVKTLERRV
jgi:two-component system response regulator BaeR